MSRLSKPLMPGCGRKVISVICGYELIALHTPLPTISELMHRLRINHTKAAAVLFVCLDLIATLIAAHHLLLEEVDPKLLEKLIKDIEALDPESS